MWLVSLASVGMFCKRSNIISSIDCSRTWRATASTFCPQGLKPAWFAGVSGTTKEAAEKVVERVRSTPQALKRGHIFDDLTARVNSRPSQNPLEPEFFRSL